MKNVTPMIASFMAGVKSCTFDSGLYTRRANVWRAYKTYLEYMGVAPAMKPCEFYTEMATYLNTLRLNSYAAMKSGVPEIVLAEHKAYDVFLNVAIPEFWSTNAQPPELAILNATLAEYRTPAVQLTLPSNLEK